MKGYIVLGGNNRPLVLCRYEKGDPSVLTSGGDATVFPTYDGARAAIRRTNRYADRHAFRWEKKHFIMPLRPPSEANR